MKKSFLILSLLALTFIACPPPEPEPQPEPEKPTLSKIDITDAAALFVEPSGTDAGKIFKIKKDLTTIEEVKYTNTDGSSADMGNLKASYVINAHNDYAIIGFAADPNKAKTYDFELIADKAYLVRKSDGKVFSLENTPSCTYIIPVGNKIYYPSGKIDYQKEEWQSGNGYSEYWWYGDKLMEITIADTKIVQRNILTIDMKDISMFNPDKENNLFVCGNGYGKIYSSQDGLFYDFYQDWDLYNTFIFGCFYSRRSSYISFFSNTSTPKQVENYCELDAVLPTENKIIMSYQYNNRQIIIYNSEEALAKNPDAKLVGNIFIFKNENNTVSLLSPAPIWLESDPVLLPYAENEYVYIPRKDSSGTQSVCTIYNLTTGEKNENCYFRDQVESFIVCNGTTISAEHNDQFQYLRKGGTLGATLRNVEATGEPVHLVGTGSPMYYQIPYINEVWN